MEKRLDADAPLGFLLSGGLDSSLVCAISAKLLGKKIRTFAIGMDLDPIDLKYAREVADFIGAEHTEVSMTKQDVLDALEPVIALLGTYDITTIRASIGMYLCCNQNLLFHGCVPMDEEGNFAVFRTQDGEALSGKAFMDYTETMARQGYYGAPGSPERQLGKDFLWYLWCGRISPLYGRDKMTTFERLLIGEPALCKEEKNPYYIFSSKAETCLRILQEFGLNSEYSHIINGHVPVRSKDGETPVKAGGRLIVIDGGFCKVYQPQTGIAGYTLIYNSHGIRITSHEPFGGVQDAIRNNKDILSTSMIFETRDSRIKIADTDDGQIIREHIQDLKLLLAAYQAGLLKEEHKGGHSGE